MNLTQSLLSGQKKFGGNVSYDSFESLESDFSQKKLHPADLKQSVENH